MLMVKSIYLDVMRFGGIFRFKRVLFRIMIYIIFKRNQIICLLLFKPLVLGFIRTSLNSVSFFVNSPFIVVLKCT